MAEPRVERDELIAALAARRELGAELEPAVIDSFVERLERAIDARVDREVDRRMQSLPRQRASGGGGFGIGIGHIILALGSLGIGVGATGAATGMGDAAGVVVALVAWAAIALVNMAYAFSSR
jgi:hypothetical protein